MQNENTKTCYCCGKKGHVSPKCPEKDKIPREDWAIRKAEQHMQAEQMMMNITIGQEFEENQMEQNAGVSDGQEEGHIKQDEG